MFYELEPRAIIPHGYLRGLRETTSFTRISPCEAQDLFVLNACSADRVTRSIVTVYKVQPIKMRATERRISLLALPVSLMSTPRRIPKRRSNNGYMSLLGNRREASCF